MSETLELIYENISIFTEKNNYTRLPNEAPFAFKRIADAGIASLDRLMVAWSVLTYKHDGRNPFPSHDELAGNFGVSKTSIVNAINDLKNAGLFIIEKGKYAGMDKRKNTYNVSPFLNLVGSFIEKFRSGEDVCIKSLYKSVLRGSVKATKVSKEEVAEQKEEKVDLDESIMVAISKAETDKHRKELTNVVGKHVDRLGVDTTVWKIEAILKGFDSSKGSISKYAEKALSTAEKGAELVYKQTTKVSNPRQNVGREEDNLEWLDKTEEEWKEKEAIKKKYTLQEIAEMEKHDDEINEKARLYVENVLYEQETGRTRGDSVLDYVRWSHKEYEELPEDSKVYNNTNISLYNYYNEDNLHLKLG